jgi:ADP-heptose:LPS heptosyltransferase
MQRALLIHGGAVGDFVMSLRVVAALRAAGATSLAVLGRPEIAQVAGPADGVDKVLDLNVGGYHALFSQTLELPPRVLESLRRFDLAVNMLGGPTAPRPRPGALPADGRDRAEDPTRRRLHDAGIRRVITIDPRPRADCHGHVSDQWLADLRAAGIKATAGPPRIRLDETSLRHARSRLEAETQAGGRPVAILHPGSGGQDKCWPVQNFIKLAARLQAADRRVAFLMGPAELERFSRVESDHLQAVAPTFDGCSLREAAALIAASRLYVGNDSGMSHVAAALEIETATIFGPTDPVRWRPLGKHVTILRSPSPGTWPSVVDVFRSLP